MPNTQSFNDFDEFMEAMRRDMEAADSRVQPWQAEIRVGDYFRKDTPYGFYIYGQVLKEEEPRPNDLEHYRLCRAYSLACPGGEMGDVHVSTIEKLISEEDFDEAKERDWN